MFTALGYVRAKLVVYQEDCNLFRVFHLLLSYPLASKGGITVMIVLPVHKQQYIIHKCAASSMFSHVA